MKFLPHYFFLRYMLLSTAALIALQSLSAAPAAKPDFAKPKTFLNLADRFADEQDYYRAITEYKKVIFLFPEYEKLDWVHFQIGKMYYEGGRFPQAKNELIPLTEAKDEKLQFYALNYIALSYFENEEYSNAERLFLQLKEKDEGKIYWLDYTIYAGMATAGNHNFAEAYTRIENAQNEWKKSSVKGDKFHAQYGNFFEKAIPLLDDARKLSEKSPFWATLFSILLPGGGHVYLGEWDTGIVSFTLVGGAAFLAYDGFMKDNMVQSIIFTTFATGAYIGQAYSSYRTARKYNAELGNEEWRTLKREFHSLNVALQFQSQF
ncbi:MAG TPA: hypothetical protein PLY93_07765 [Turneriella sp.]|nr:hypothetical protein [Turneriella sp.]